MPYYNLRNVFTGEEWNSVQRTRDDAVADFGRQLGTRLSLEDRGEAVTDYMMAEREEAVGWLDHNIPVHEINE